MQRKVKTPHLPTSNSCFTIDCCFRTKMILTCSSQTIVVKTWLTSSWNQRIAFLEFLDVKVKVHKPMSVEICKVSIEEPLIINSNFWFRAKPNEGLCRSAWKVQAFILYFINTLWSTFRQKLTFFSEMYTFFSQI